MATFYLISQWLAQYGQSFRRRHVVYPIHQTVKYLYLRIATVRFITAPLVRKQFVLPLLMFYTFYLFYCASDGLPASSGLCCYDLRIRH